MAAALFVHAGQCIFPMTYSPHDSCRPAHDEIPSAGNRRGVTPVADSRDGEAIKSRLYALTGE